MIERTGRTTERYVALGDSYTIGESVLPEESWPSRLVAHLRREGVAIDLIANPSVTGWTSAQLIEHELPVLERSRATFVTILIGVNDWVQDVPEDTFRANLEAILDRAQAMLPHPERLLLLTIPDFSVTPQGAQYARGRDITAGIAAFNDVIRAAGTARHLAVVDLFPHSRRLTAAEFVAADGLHPSAASYARWEELVFPAALRLLRCERQG